MPGHGGPRSWLRINRQDVVSGRRLPCLRRARRSGRRLLDAGDGHGGYADRTASGACCAYVRAVALSGEIALSGPRSLAPAIVALFRHTDPPQASGTVPPYASTIWASRSLPMISGGFDPLPSRSAFMFQHMIFDGPVKRGRSSGNRRGSNSSMA